MPEKEFDLIQGAMYMASPFTNTPNNKKASALFSFSRKESCDF